MGSMTSLISLEMPSGSTVSVYRRRFGTGEGAKVAFVAGLRGDAPEGIRVAHLLSEFLDENEQFLRGTVDVYPCVNPLAAEQGKRLWPFFNVDLNRLFPGKNDGHPPSQVARALIDDIDVDTLVVELRGARPGFSEMLQALIRADSEASVAPALACNVDVVWKRYPGPAAGSTFAYQFPNAIVLEGGRGNQLTQEVGRRLYEGCLNLLMLQQILPDSCLPFSWLTIERPKLLDDENILRVRVNRSGIFLPSLSLGETISKGDEIGRVLEPASGVLREKVWSPSAGRVLALRNQPVVSAGIMVARIWWEA